MISYEQIEPTWVYLGVQSPQLEVCSSTDQSQLSASPSLCLLECRHCQSTDTHTHDETSAKTFTPTVHKKVHTSTTRSHQSRVSVLWSSATWNWLIQTADHCPSANTNLKRIVAGSQKTLPELINGIKIAGKCTWNYSSMPKPPCETKHLELTQNI